MSAQCPRCGKRAVVDGGCFLCGFRKLPDIQTPEHTCITCGRKLRFDGIVCDACTAAIQLGAVTLRKTRDRNLSLDRSRKSSMRFASCPVVKVLEKLAAQFRAEREKLEAQLRAEREAREEKIRAARKRWYARHREEQKTRMRERNARLWATDPEYREKKHLQSALDWQMRKADPEKLAKQRARVRVASRVYYYAHREEINARRRAKSARKKEEQHVACEEILDVAAESAA